MDYAYEGIDPKLGRYFDGPKSQLGVATREQSLRDCPLPYPQSVYYGNQGGNWDPEYHREYASTQHKDTRYSTDFDAENWKAWAGLSLTGGAVHGRMWQYALWCGYGRGRSWSRSGPYIAFCMAFWYTTHEWLRKHSLSQRYNFDMSYLYDKALKVACHEGTQLGYEMYCDPKKVGPYKYNPHHFNWHFYACP